ncbi:MAG: DUF4421 family protein [Flavobacteriales bacterium]|nr:DUF4421 family protein [Flavobacteriales bacterium]
MPTNPQLLTLATVVLAHAASAQRSSDVHGSLRTPAYDTTFITSYYDNFVITALMRTQGNEVELTGRNEKSISYSTNDVVQYGFGLDLRWFTIEAAFSVPYLSTPDATKGITSSNGIGFGLTGRKWWFRNFLSRSEGYHVLEPWAYDSLWQPEMNHPYRRDLEQTTYMASINHGFNGARYSHNAALWQLERQRRSAGSWTAGATLWISEMKADSTLIPFQLQSEFNDTTQFIRMQRFIIGVTGGYTHTFVFLRKAFLNLMLVPGITATQHNYAIPRLGDVSTEWVVGGYAEGRFSMGYNAEQWYVALSGSTYAASSSVGEQVDLGTTFSSVRLATGIRLRKPNIPMLRKVGL